MDPASPAVAAELLRRHGIHPSRRLGQNFLCDPNTLDKIVDAASLESTDRALEIGPGLGALTVRLAPKCSHVTAVEIDSGLAQLLPEVLSGVSNVVVHHADFLSADLDKLFTEAFGTAPGMIVANIPYAITTPIIERLIEFRDRWKRAVLLTQWEVAARLRALPGTKEYGSLSIFAQYYLKVSVPGKVSRTVFLPRPDVDSGILVLEPQNHLRLEPDAELALFQITRAAFGQRRKTLRNSLGNSGHWTESHIELALRGTGIDPQLRGEALSVEQFCHLAEQLSLCQTLKGLP